jgi:hypothetical protein
MIEKFCRNCRQIFHFKEGEVTAFKDGLCHDCYCIDGQFLCDSNSNLYYIDDDGYRIPAPPEVEERLLSVPAVHEPEYDEVPF